MVNRERLWQRLVSYSNTYEISVQLWPKMKTIYIAKDDVDLYSYGSYDLDDTITKVLEYLDRINKKDDKRTH